MKQYIGISRDHSASMRSLTKAAQDDYNNTIDAINSAATENDIDTVVSVVNCGVGPSGRVTRDIVNSSITKLKQMTSYTADGGSTPLFDSVGELITMLEDVPDFGEKDVSFMIYVVTDGEENSSGTWRHKLAEKIKKLQATDKWTFVFRVPHGYKTKLASLGIPAGNIEEWETTEKGMREASLHAMAGMRSFYSARKTTGITHTDSFFADLSATKKEVKATLTNISKEVKFLKVKSGGTQIRDFVESKTKKGMKLGSAFYQLTKPEKKVQDYKMIALRDKTNGAVYAGQNARDLLGLPDSGTIKLEPGNSPKYDIFVQSTSVNRKLIAGTEVLLWPSAAR